MTPCSGAAKNQFSYMLERKKVMKKSYVKPVASNVVFAMNENIASSANVGHLGYVNHAGIMDGTCNKLLAFYNIDSQIVGGVENFEDLTNSLIDLRVAIGNDAFEEIMVDIRNNSFKCWKK
jgi:hypothetical protein